MELSIINEYDASRDLASKPFRSACYAPWTSLVFDSIGRVRACCVNVEYPLGDISKERIDDIWNGPRVAEFRKSLQCNDFSLGCGFGEWKLKNGAFRAEKAIYSAFMPVRFEGFAIEPHPPYWPKHMEFHLSNRCNLECVTCFGEFSSGIRKKRDKLPPYPMVYNDQFFEDLEKYLPHLVWTQFLGGEPFIIPEMQRIWNMLIEGNLSPHCHITTNGTVWGDKVERILECLPTAISVSMDGATKETFDAIRKNAKFERVCENLRRFRDLCRRRHQGIAINFTLSRFNWRELPDMLLFAEDEGVELHIIDLGFPEVMSLYSLVPEDLKKVIDELESRMNKIRPRLRYLGATFDAKLTELRYRLNNSNERALKQHEELTPLLDVPVRVMIEKALSHIELTKKLVKERQEEIRADQKTEREDDERLRKYSWHVFEKVHDTLSVAMVRDQLNQWSNNSPIDHIECDVNDHVISIDSEPGGILEGVDEAIGVQQENLILILSTRLGEQFELLESIDDPRNYQRTVKFSGSNRESTLVRSIFVPRRDGFGEVIGISILLAHQLEPVARVLPEG